MDIFTRISQPVLIVIGLLMIATQAFAAEPPVFTGRGEFAINGYDTVAYHKEQKPVKGDSSYTAQWNGANWRFASNENRDLFESNPERWAPRYGGYCAWAVSNNYTAKTDPDAWSIVDDRLYLNFSRSVRRTWSKDIPGNIERAEANWPEVLKK